MNYLFTIINLEQILGVANKNRYKIIRILNEQLNFNIKNTFVPELYVYLLYLYLYYTYHDDTILMIQKRTKAYVNLR